jgi:hypothetical protein
MASSQPRAISARWRSASQEPDQLDDVQPAESQPKASPAQSFPASREPDQPDRVQPAESHFHSIASSQRRASPTRSCPASRETFRLNRIQPVESKPRSIECRQPQCSQPSRPSGIGQDGDGRPESVRPRAGRRRRHLFEAGRRRTEWTAVDGEILAHITKIIRK